MMIKKEDYAEVDAAILSSLPNTMAGLTKRLEHLSEKHPGPFFRVLDRRLQALRKAGKISYTNTKWTTT